ncbi:hypothetical protein B0H21DRAFT_711906 [Amylocystis lapponica]|nr:hypothetical protein B0H21DRAFT_711906 [Amylocystis lapponica]
MVLVGSQLQDELKSQDEYRRWHIHLREVQTADMLTVACVPGDLHLYASLSQSARMRAEYITPHLWVITAVLSRWHQCVQGPHGAAVSPNRATRESFAGALHASRPSNAFPQPRKSRGRLMNSENIQRFRMQLNVFQQSTTGSAAGPAPLVWRPAYPIYHVGSWYDMITSRRSALLFHTDGTRRLLTALSREVDNVNRSRTRAAAEASLTTVDSARDVPHPPRLAVMLIPTRDDWMRVRPNSWGCVRLLPAPCKTGAQIHVEAGHSGIHALANRIQVEEAVVGFRSHPRRLRNTCRHLPCFMPLHVTSAVPSALEALEVQVIGQGICRTESTVGWTHATVSGSEGSSAGLVSLT